jgi:hypothetical protein
MVYTLYVILERIDKLTDELICRGSVVWQCWSMIRRCYSKLVRVD